MKLPKEYITAMHEAGHAVMCITCGATMNYVTVIPKGEAKGECDKVPIYYTKDDTDELKYNKTLVDSIVRYAGFIVERDILGVDIEQCTIDAIMDFKAIQDVIYSVYPNDNDTVIKLREDTKDMTAYMIQQPLAQRQIKAVADALMVHKTITGEQVIEIMRSAAP